MIGFCLITGWLGCWLLAIYMMLRKKLLRTPKALIPVAFCLLPIGPIGLWVMFWEADRS